MRFETDGSSFELNKQNSVSFRFVYIFCESDTKLKPGETVSRNRGIYFKECSKFRRTKYNLPVVCQNLNHPVLVTFEFEMICVHST